MEDHHQLTVAEMQQKFENLRQRAIKDGIRGSDMEKLPSLQLLRVPKTETNKSRNVKKMITVIVSSCVLFILIFLVVWLTEWPVSNLKLLEFGFDWYNLDIEKEPCVVNVMDSVLDIARPPINCEMCKNLQQIQRVSQITSLEFEMKFAYSSIPVIIVDATKNWTATETFNFTFFKSIYMEDSPALLNVESHCQFFPYKTNFESLGEVFNMSEERAILKDGTEPWYIGWSNCDSSAANVLRQHYERPYFLPKNAESSKTDWIFMGSPGYGAHMHIDNVGNPSWQAQITGTKRWTLEPPPECYFQCEQVQVIVYPGEVIVLDTNNWYHSTLILGEEMSITIGSEYD